MTAHMRALPEGGYRGKIAVITGAAAGMGRSLATILATRGARLAICDLDTARLEETARQCREHGADVLTMHVDVAQRDQVREFAEAVAAHYGHAHYLFNNAGIGFCGTFDETDHADLERVMNVDFWGVVHGTRAFLPLLAASGEGHVVNTSSILGLFGLPALNAYSAAKFAVRGFSESLRQELLIARKPVSVTCVHPGFIRTDIGKNMRSATGRDDGELSVLFDRVATTSSDSAARQILAAAHKGRPKALVGIDAVVIDLVVRVFGHRYQWPLAKLVGRIAPATFGKTTVR